MHQPLDWIIAPPAPAEAAELAAALKTSPLIAQMLLNRGLRDVGECQRFLSPTLMHLHEPARLPGLMTAAERLSRAIRDREKIVIYGDYDVDGITGTAILWHAIRILGGQAEYYIPHRLDEGYGLNAEAMAQICDAGAQLIVTVDCGVTALEEARIAAERGVDLIITDHHEWHASGPENLGGRPELPVCHAVVHPRLGAADPSAAYPNPCLCGAGVAFKLAWGLGQIHNGATRVSEPFRNFLVEATALAALGTIADVVPLTGENRSLAHFGLGGLMQSRLIGIRALIESAGLTGQKLNSYHVGFLLAPRLNACGRMGHAREAVELLTRADAAAAARIAGELEKQNRARQLTEREIFRQAMEQARSLGCDADECRGVVLASEGWHPGVIGIVASRVVNRLNRPTIMIALANGHGHGSGRSIAGFHLARALDACRQHLETCGGHEMAAGLRLRRERLDDFRRAFADYARGAVSDQMLRPALHLDCEAQLGQITGPLVDQINRMGPFGTANPRPLLCVRDVEVAAVPRRVGKSGEHLQLVVRQNGSRVRCIAFGQGALFERLVPGTRVDLAAEAVINEYNGFRNVQLEIRDVRFRGNQAQR